MVIRNGDTIPISRAHRNRVQALAHSIDWAKLPVWLSGLALVSSAIIDAAGYTYFMFPVALSLTAMAILVLNAKTWHLNLGAKWAWIPLLIIWLSAFVHLCWTSNYQGICFCTWIVALYFLGRSVGSKIWKYVVWGSVAASIFLIATKLGVFLSGTQELLDTSLWKPHHLAGFLVLVGMVLSKNWKVWALGSLAIVLSGSEEGIAGLGIVLGISFIRLWLAGRQKLILGLCALGLLTGLTLWLTGYGVEAFPNLTLSRFSSFESLYHLRTEPIANLLKSGDWILGTGFTWSVMWDTPHIVVLKIASQFGIIAGLAWLYMMLAGLIKTQYKLLLAVMLWYSLIDHSLWTELAIWSPMVVGIASIEREKKCQV